MPGVGLKIFYQIFEMELLVLKRELHKPLRIINPDGISKPVIAHAFGPMKMILDISKTWPVKMIFFTCRKVEPVKTSHCIVAVVGKPSRQSRSFFINQILIPGISPILFEVEQCFFLQTVNIKYRYFGQRLQQNNSSFVAQKGIMLLFDPGVSTSGKKLVKESALIS